MAAGKIKPGMKNKTALKYHCVTGIFLYRRNGTRITRIKQLVPQGGGFHGEADKEISVFICPIRLIRVPEFFCKNFIPVSPGHRRWFRCALQWGCPYNKYDYRRKRQQTMSVPL
jgi:hypothetical protein